MKTRKILQVASHRNGVAGEGFHVVRFDDPEGGSMVAVVFEKKGQVAVLNIKETAKGNIAFAQGNSWRGDRFEPFLREAVNAFEAARA